MIDPDNLNQESPALEAVGKATVGLSGKLVSYSDYMGPETPEKIS